SGTPGPRTSKPVIGAKSAESAAQPAAPALHAGAIEESAAARAHLRLLAGKTADDAVGVRDRGGAEPKRVAHAGRTLGRRRLILGEGARHGTDEAGDGDGDDEAAANRGHDSLLWFQCCDPQPLLTLQEHIAAEWPTVP